MSPRTREAGEEEMVETAIGPLPADLWGLIGERPPARPAEPSLAAAGEPLVQRQPATRPEPEISRREEATRPERRAARGAPDVRTSAEAVLQRAAAESTGAESAPPPPSEQAAGGAAAANAGGVNMDELAMKVYGEVKRRLSVEWERLRRRM